MAQVNIKINNFTGLGLSGLYDCVDNNGYYLFQQLGTSSLTAGLTISVADNTKSYTLTPYPQSATWSSLNPYTPGVNAPSVPSLLLFDSVNKGSGVVLSNGNKTAAISSQGIAIGNKFHSTGSGKYYCEINITYPTLGMFGFIGSTYLSANLNKFIGFDPVGWGINLYSSGSVDNNNTAIRTNFTGGVQFSGYTYLLAFDATAGNFYLGIYYGGAYWYNTSGGAYSFASATPMNLSPVSGSFTIGVGYGALGTETYVLNSGQSAYVSTPPAGYTNW
jgi:hypothetical protein